MFDQYPYLAGSTTLTALLPPACLEGGIPTLLRNLNDPTFRARARRGIEEGVPGWWNPVAGSGWDSVVVADAPHTVEHEGKKLSDIGQELGGDGFDALCELLAANSGAVSIVIFMMSEDDLLNGMRHPLVMVGSDGFATSPDAGLGGSRPHPPGPGSRPWPAPRRPHPPADHEHASIHYLRSRTPSRRTPYLPLTPFRRSGAG